MGMPEFYILFGLLLFVAVSEALHIAMPFAPYKALKKELEDFKALSEMRRQSIIQLHEESRKKNLKITQQYCEIESLKARLEDYEHYII